MSDSASIYLMHKRTGKYMEITEEGGVVIPVLKPDKTTKFKLMETSDGIYIQAMHSPHAQKDTLVAANDGKVHFEKWDRVRDQRWKKTGSDAVLFQNVGFPGRYMCQDVTKPTHVACLKDDKDEWIIEDA